MGKRVEKKTPMFIFYPKSFSKTGFGWYSTPSSMSLDHARAKSAWKRSSSWHKKLMKKKKKQKKKTHLCVGIHPACKCGVLSQSNVRRKHHELSRAVLKLAGTSPLALGPLFLLKPKWLASFLNKRNTDWPSTGGNTSCQERSEKKSKVLNDYFRELNKGEPKNIHLQIQICPCGICQEREHRSKQPCSKQNQQANKKTHKSTRYNLLIGESHAVEDAAQMIGTLRCVRKTAIGSRGLQ